MGQIKKVVTDINVLVSAFGWGGSPKKILDLLEKRSIINYTSPELLTDLRRVVAYPKLKFSDSLQNQIVEFVLINSHIIEPKEKLAVIKDDPDDDRVLECALESGAEFIISGDIHLLSIKEYGKIKIVTAVDFINNFVF